MKTRHLRFYSPGDDSGGANGKAQGAADTSQGDDQDKDKAATDDQGSNDADKDKGSTEDDRLSRENARRRLENQQLQEQLKELQGRLEAAEDAKLSDSDKLQKAQDKLQKAVAEAERKAKEAERKYFSSRAVATYKLPDVLSDMLQGATEDEVDEHAKLVSAALEKWGREKFRQTAPDTEGGNRHDKNGASKLSAEQQRQHELETARTF